MVLTDVEETTTIVEIVEETQEELIQVPKSKSPVP